MALTHNGGLVSSETSNTEPFAKQGALGNEKYSLFFLPRGRFTKTAIKSETVPHFCHLSCKQALHNMYQLFVTRVVGRKTAVLLYRRHS